MRICKVKSSLPTSALLLVSLFVSVTAADKICDAADAKPVDGGVAVVGVIAAEILIYLWFLVGISIVGRRDELWKREFTCATGDLCLSLKAKPFCYNKETKTFKTSQGITGNVATGDYTLADGRKGNLYKGPWPLPAGARGGDGAPVSSTATDSAASSSSVITTTTDVSPTSTPSAISASGTGSSVSPTASTEPAASTKPAGSAASGNAIGSALLTFLLPALAFCLAFCA